MKHRTVIYIILSAPMIFIALGAILYYRDKRTEPSPLVIQATVKKMELPSLEKQQIFWNDVLLIISYHQPHYETIPFLEKIYGTYFPHIVFYGLKSAHPKVELISDPREWLVSYKSLIHALQKYTKYKGYLWIQDDCIINPWNFYRFDKEKIWHDPHNNADLSLGKKAIKNWVWWPSKWGCNVVKTFYDQLPKKYKEVLQYNCGNNTVCWGYSDIVFIPASVREDAIQVFSMCEKHGIMLEIALPITCAALAKKENSELFHGLALWGRNQRNACKLYDVELDYIHPIKFSNECNRNFIEKISIATLSVM